MSGYAAHWSGADRRQGAAYAAMLQRRALRWLLPALLFGLVILAGKCLTEGLLHVDNAPVSFLQGLIKLLWHTGQSPAQSVWYLIVLLAYAALVPPLLLLLHGRLGLLCLVSLGLMPVPLPPLLFADRLLLYLPFYLGGLWAAREDVPWCALLDRHARLLCRLFAVTFGLLVLAGADGILMRMPHALPLLAGLVAIPALHAGVRRLPPGALLLLDRLGPHAFTIYLLNTVFIGLAKALLMTVIPWEARWFPLFAPVLMAAGVLGPVLCRTLLPGPQPLPGRVTR